MATLISLIPDIEVLLALSSEAFSFVLLQLANEHKQNGIIHPQALLQQINGTPGIGWVPPE